MRSSQSFTLVRATMSFVFKIAFLLVFGPAVCDNEPGDNKTAVEATTLVQNSNKTIFASWQPFTDRMLAEVRKVIVANSSNLTAEFEQRFGTAAASQLPSFAENSVADKTHTENKGVAGIAASNYPPFVENTMADSTVAYDKHIPGTAAATPPPSLVENRGAENKSETTENGAEAASPPTSFAETHVAVKSHRNGTVDGDLHKQKLNTTGSSLNSNGQPKNNKNMSLDWQAVTGPDIENWSANQETVSDMRIRNRGLKRDAPDDGLSLRGKAFTPKKYLHHFLKEIYVYWKGQDLIEYQVFRGLRLFHNGEQLDQQLKLKIWKTNANLDDKPVFLRLGGKETELRFEVTSYTKVITGNKTGIKTKQMRMGIADIQFEDNLFSRYNVDAVIEETV